MRLENRIKKLEKQKAASVIDEPAHLHVINADKDPHERDASCSLCQAMTDNEYQEWLTRRRGDGRIDLVVIRKTYREELSSNESSG